MSTYDRQAETYGVEGECSVHEIDWPYDCDAKKSNPDATVYMCDTHRVWWFES